MSEQIRISILGRNEIIREGLKMILLDQGFDVARTVSEASDLDGNNEPDNLIIVDSNGFSEGLMVCRTLREKFSQVRIVLMVDEYRIEDVSAAFSAGVVDGYLVKAISCEPLAGVLRLIAMGEKVLPSQVAESFTNPVQRAVSRNWEVGCAAFNLSSRELEILRCLVSGDANKLISRRLQIADATVKVHIKAILRKLRVKNRTQAAIWAVTRGLPVEGTWDEDMRSTPPHVAARMRTEELQPVAV